jgi:uncharacterized protein (DUF305 family)
MVTKRRLVPNDESGAIKMSTPIEPTLRSSWSWAQVIGFGAACTFLGACLMYGAHTYSERRVDATSLGFVRDMIDHHDQAVQMSVRVQSSASDLAVQQIAMDIIQEQRYEIGMMDTWLEEWNSTRGEYDRVAMVWMDMGSPVDQMMGMQDPDAVRALSTLPTQQAELSFLKMMQDHHRGGIDMAKHAADHADKAEVRNFAKRVMAVQNSEINEIQAVINRLESAK